MSRLSRNLLFSIGVLAFYATLTSCITMHRITEKSNTIEEAMSLRPEQRPAVTLEQENEGFELVKRLANRFSLKFFKNITQWQPTSVVLSPLSFFLSLSMLAYGAQGTGRDLFLSAVGVRRNETRIAKYGYKRLINTLADYNMRISTKVYYAADLIPVPFFTKLAKDFFKADIEAVDVDNEYISTEKLNDWLKDRTNNECTELFKEPLKVGPKPSFVLVNAVYFKGVWESPFDRIHTTQRPFYLFDEDAVSVPTMHKLGRMPYGRIESMRASFVELSFKSNGVDDAMSMFIILPDGNRPTSAIVDELDKFSLNDLLNSTLRDVELYLPKFKFQYSQQLPSSTLDKVLGEALNPFNIQPTFSNMMAGGKSMSYGWGAVKYVIEVDEDGDKTAGSTGAFYTKNETKNVDRNVRSIEPDPTFVEFDANHSFIAIIATKGEVLLDLFTVVYNGL